MISRRTESDAENARRSLAQGRKSLSEKNYHGSIIHFDRALELSPCALDLQGNTLEGVQFLCDYVEALMRVSHIDRAVALVDERADLLTEGLLSEHPMLRLVLGEMYSSLGRADEAENELLEALGSFQDTGNRDACLRTLHCLLGTYTRMKRYDNAVGMCRLLSDQFRTIKGLRGEFGTVFYRVSADTFDGRCSNALTDLVPLLSQVKGTEYENHLGALELLATCYNKLGEYPQAIEVLEDIKRLYSGELAYGGGAQDYRIGVARLRTGDFSRAIPILRQAHKLLLSFSSRHWHKAAATLAEALSTAGDSSDSSALIRKSRDGLSQGGEEALEISIGIAGALGAMGKTVEAIQILDEAVSKADYRLGERAYALYRLGLLRMKSNQMLKASENLRDAYQAYERMGSSYYTQLIKEELDTIPSVGLGRPALKGVADKLRVDSILSACVDLSAAQDLDTLLNRTFERVRDLCGATGIAIVARDAVDQDLLNILNQSSVGDSEAVLDSAREVLGTILPALGSRGNLTWMCVPVYQASAGAIGALFVERQDSGKPFTDEDQAFVIAVASLLSAAIVNERLQERINETTLFYQDKVEESYKFGEIVGNSSAIREVFGLIHKSAATQLPVMVRGETGTGKELVARAIHEQSSRSKGPFLSINCASFGSELLQSELFGHRKGSFTGATEDRPGLLEAAEGGTIFLDEIGDASPHVQSSLLRVLQEGEIRRVGDNRHRQVDVRIISATNRNLEEDVEASRFRKDLYYRLRVLQIEVPPLRLRKEDIPSLAEHILDKEGPREGKRLSGIRADAMDALVAYDWPGNVRELENEIKRSVALAADDEPVIPEHFAFYRGESVSASRMEPGGFKSTVEALEKALVLQGLDQCGQNISQTARFLGLSRNGLQKKMSKLGLRN